MVLFPACKKQSDKPVNPNNGPFIIATLDGNDQWHSITQGGIDVNDTLGIGGEATDGSFLYIYFSDAVLALTPLNTPFTPLSMDYKYILGPDDVFTSTLTGGAASVTLTTYDANKRSIAGSFSGTVIHTLVNGTHVIETIAKGQFFVNY